MRVVPTSASSRLPVEHHRGANDCGTGSDAARDDTSWDEDVRLAVYRAFADHGRAPTAPELADAAGGSLAVAKQALHRLAAARHLVLDECEHVVLAHPFAAIPLGFSVMGARTLWWGGCAWDSFAIPHLVDDEPEVLVATRCPGCGQPHALVVEPRGAARGRRRWRTSSCPPRRMWDDVLHTCEHQRLFCCESCVDAWLAATGHDKGYVLDLVTLWRLAARLVRRAGWSAATGGASPDCAVAYFAEAGLTGPFWAATPESDSPHPGAPAARGPAGSARMAAWTRPFPTPTCPPTSSARWPVSSAGRAPKSWRPSRPWRPGSTR